VRGVDLEVRPGERRAVLGPNGAGKTTVFNLISGEFPPSSGRVELFGQDVTTLPARKRARLGLSRTFQTSRLFAGLSVEDNLHLTQGFPTRFGTLRAKAMRSRTREAIEQLHLDVRPGAKVETLSPAQRTGVAVARALQDDVAAPARLIVMDEPTATLPQDEVARLLGVVRNVAAGGVAVVFVTHRLDELIGFADRLTVLRDGVRQTTRPMEEITRREIVHLMVGAEFEEAHAEAQALESVEHVPVLRVRHLDSTPLRDIDLTVASGEILGIAGLTGSGRETLLSAIFGGMPRDGGEVSVGSDALPPQRPDLAVRLGIGYVPPDRKVNGALMDLSAQENLVLPALGRLWKFPALRESAAAREAVHWFRELDVRPINGMRRPLSTFSGGNQQKVVLGKWLRLGSRVLLLDEPTQGVDVGAKAVIYHHLVQAAAAGAGVVVASSDSDELASLCHRVLILRNGRVAAELVGAAVSTRNISAGVLGGDTPARTAQPAARSA